MLSPMFQVIEKNILRIARFLEPKPRKKNYFFWKSAKKDENFHTKKQQYPTMGVKKILLKGHLNR